MCLLPFLQCFNLVSSCDRRRWQNQVDAASWLLGSALQSKEALPINTSVPSLFVESDEQSGLMVGRLT